jgi:hypothetical protein
LQSIWRAISPSDQPCSIRKQNAVHSALNGLPRFGTDPALRRAAVQAEEDYKRAKREGSAVHAYLSAAVVADAYLKAGDQANYLKWKKIQAEEAQRAGIRPP